MKRENRKNISEINPIENQKSTDNFHQLEVFERYGFQKIFGEIILPIYLMTSVPMFTMILWYICRYCNGNITDFMKIDKSSTELFYDVLFNQYSGSLFPIYVIIGYIIWITILTIILPGELYKGPVTDKGNTPVYKKNGTSFFIVNLVSFFVLSGVLEYFGYSVTSICDRYGEFLFLFNVGGFLFCFFLYIKGLFFPSSSDNSSSGNPIFDFYWGVELYPRIRGIDLKLMTNCRWGMMVWSLVVILFWMKSLKTYGFVDSHFITMILINFYLAKFFHWESGYMKTMDIVVDRAGFYLCFGCICFVPLFYTLPSIYLAYHPVHLGLPLATLNALVGFLCLYINYDADYQKFIVRKTNGNCLIWNKKPDFIRAKYVLLDGSKRESILLASGYWGISRHFHYIPEIGLAFCWCNTAMFQGFLPYSYVCFLFMLLIHRSVRDDTKCFHKYGNYWEQYRSLVPYKIIPGLF